MSRALLLFLEGSLSLCIVFLIDLIFQIVCHVSRLFTGALPGWRAALTHATCLPFCSLTYATPACCVGCTPHLSRQRCLPVCCLPLADSAILSPCVGLVCLSVSPFLFLNTCTCTNAHTYSDAHTHVHPRKASRMHTHTPHTYTCTRKNTHTNTHTHAHAHTHSCTPHTASLELGTIIWVESLRCVLISPNCDYTCMNNASSVLINVKHFQGILNT